MKLLALFFTGVLLFGQQPASDLDSKVKSKISGFNGHVSLYAKEFDHWCDLLSFGRRSRPRTASTIKFPIMIRMFCRSGGRQPRTHAEPIRLLEEEKVSGSGILQDLSSGRDYPVHDLIMLMITLSDNTATNLILMRVTGNAVNARMAKIGLTQTRSMRKILGDPRKAILSPPLAGLAMKGRNPKIRSGALDAAARMKWSCCWRG